jgi:phage nucleotide-binding protein
MAIRLTTTSQAAQLHGVKILTYGKAGMGKTTLCATAPTPIILSAEAGLLSLRGHEIPVIEIKTIEDLQEAYQWATESAEAAHFETVCLDSLSEIAEVVLLNAKRVTKDPRQAYGALIEKMGNTVRAFRDLSGKHVYMSAKQESVKDETAGTTLYGPSMPGAKLGGQLPYLFDEVFRLNIGRTPDGVEYRYLQTRPDFQSDAKDRSGSLDAMEQADLTAIINKILNLK